MEVEVTLTKVDNDRILHITNRTPKDIGWEMFMVEGNYGSQMPPVKPNGWYKLNLDKSRPIIRDSKIVTFLNYKVKLYSYRIENVKLIKIEPNKEISLDSPFICITGHQGSGTSIVLKSLRYFGCHAGDDCGDFSNRKAHESVVLRMWNNYVRCGGYSKEVIEESFYNAMGTYNYQKDKINVFKDLHMGDSRQLVNFIPNTKFISVIKHQHKNVHSPEGRKFSKADEFEIFKTQNPQLEGQPIFHLDWNRYFTDVNYCQKLLTYVGLDIELDEDGFDKMLKAINFDTNKLKKMEKIDVNEVYKMVKEEPNDMMLGEKIRAYIYSLEESK